MGIAQAAAAKVERPLNGETTICCIGVNVGALTVKVVAVRGDLRKGAVAAHLGRPVEVLEQVLTTAEFANADYFGVSRHLGRISEVAASQRALRELPDGFDAVVSLGGESFLVYLLLEGKITNVLSDNKCAAGSGEFFVQQIGRMGLSLEEAIRRSFQGRVVPLAARCSVHRKSDITHKLNWHEATPEDILHTLHDAMAGKVVALLEKAQHELRRVLLLGGLTRNAAMLAALREKCPATEFAVLPESPWFEAWGSALLARDEPRFKTPDLSVRGSLGHLPALAGYADRVQVIRSQVRPPPQESPMVLGVDAGSTTTKAILLDPAARDVVASHYTRTNGDPVAAVRECLRSLADQVGNRPVGLVGTTGSARELVGAYLGTEHVYNEISAQGGCPHPASPRARGQDARVEKAGHERTACLRRTVSGRRPRAPRTLPPTAPARRADSIRPLRPFADYLLCHHGLLLFPHGVVDFRLFLSRMLVHCLRGFIAHGVCLSSNGLLLIKQSSKEDD